MVSEQGDSTVNPGQAVYDALSDEAKAAVDALPEDLFVGESGLAAVQRMVESIKHINSLAPNIWSIQCNGWSNGAEFVVLNVGQVNMVSVNRDGLRMLVWCAKDMDRDLRSLINSISTESHDKESGTIQIGVSDSVRGSDRYPELVGAHREAVRVVASENWKINNRWKWHRDDWRVKVAMLRKTDVSAPSYVPQDRIGLPMNVPVDDVPIQGFDVQRTLARRLESAGLKYTEAQIASFYTALQTKGFVILSGISGTGKGKIAQRFAEMLPKPSSTAIDVPPEVASTLESQGFSRVTVQNYMAKFQRFYIPVAISRHLPLPLPGTAFNLPIRVNEVTGEARIRVRGTSGAYVFPKAEARTEFVSLTRQAGSFFIRFSLDEDSDLIEEVQISSKLPDSGTTSNGQVGPAEVPNGTASLSLTEATTLSNHLFLSVRPDWRDGKALIGYHNPLSGEYQRTQFLDFVIAAGDDYKVGSRNAFFVILDEMNLAHVEYYFADVLGVIESGRDEHGWTVEGISLSIGEEDADLPETLRLPPNLYIVGTVNMDETTHPFSPKVLDRAFTIELTEVDFIGYPPDKSEASESGDDDKQALLRTFTQNGRYPRIDKGDIREVVDRPERFGVDLQNLNLSLRRSRMHFGYRVFDEIMQFVFNAEENGLFIASEAFDHAVLMKVLPKFNGSRAKLQTALFELIHWCHTTGTMSSDDRANLEARFAKLTDDHTSFDAVVPKDSEAVEDQWRYPATGRRAALMMQDLYTDGFAAFG